MRERGRRGRMMIDRLSQGLEFDFSSRQREKRIPYTISFLHFFLVFFFLFPFSFPVFHSLPSPPPTPEKVDAEFSGCAREIRYSLSVSDPGDFPDARVRSRPVEGCHWEMMGRRTSLGRERIISTAFDFSTLRPRMTRSCLDKTRGD